MVGIGSALRDRARNGYSLLEAVVALAIVGMAILAATTALQSHAAMLARSAVREQLLHTAEDVLEQVRGGVLPFNGGALETSLPADPEVRGRTVVSVEPLDVDGLYRVTVTARASVPGETLAVELSTMVWRP